MSSTPHSFSDLTARLKQINLPPSQQAELTAQVEKAVGTPGVFSSKLPHIPAVAAHGTNSAGGIGADSDTGTAVSGWSDHGQESIGVRGHSTDGFGVVGQSTTHTGVWGQSQEGVGVIARSDSGIALSAISNSGVGIQAQGSQQAAAFVGDVDVAGSVSATSDTATALSAVSNSGVGIQAQGGQHAAVFVGNVEVRGDITVTGDVMLEGADCAEEFEVALAEEVNPGTVLVLDQHGLLHPCQQAYDKRVAGVVSGAGAYRPGMILDRQDNAGTRRPVALVGKVYCKVDARYAPIEVGDLLTTSPTPGHAMKADNPFQAFGAVIGKALRPLESGQDLVPILVALQ